MTRYLWVNPDNLKSSQKTEMVDGVRIIVEISPYDVPKKVTGSFVPAQNCFLIAFEYMDREPQAAEPAILSGGLKVYEGKHSKKIMSIVIPCERDQVPKVVDLKVRVQNALEELRRAPKVNEMNLDVAEEILEDNFAELTTT